MTKMKDVQWLQTQDTCSIRCEHALHSKVNDCQWMLFIQTTNQEWHSKAKMKKTVFCTSTNYHKSHATKLVTWKQINVKFFPGASWLERPCVGTIKWHTPAAPDYSTAQTATLSQTRYYIFPHYRHNLVKHRTLMLRSYYVYTDRHNVQFAVRPQSVQRGFDCLPLWYL